MTDLTQAQKDALVEALENGGRFTDVGVLHCLILPSELVFEKDGKLYLGPAGRFVAQLLRDQKPHWVPIEECGKLKAGTYIGLVDGHRRLMHWADARIPLHGNLQEWFHDDWTLTNDIPTHVLHHGTTLVIVPEVK